MITYVNSKKIVFLPHQFLAILYMLAALIYRSVASSNFEDPLYKRTFIALRFTLLICHNILVGQWVSNNNYGSSAVIYTN